jgi:hypothetical protein
MDATFGFDDDDKKQSKLSTGFMIMVTIVWVALGIAAFIMSLLCFGGSGSMTKKIFGFLLAIFFGPFYWIYFMVMKKYCKRT